MHVLLVCCHCDFRGRSGHSTHRWPVGPHVVREVVRESSLDGDALGVTAVLSELDYMGFAPEIGLTLTKTDSNIPAMTTEKAELRFGIRSVF